MKKILVFVNPRARSGAECLSEVQEWARANGLEVLNPQPSPNLEQEIFRYRNQADLVVLGGGDGTVNAALPVLLETGLPLLLLPLGTANNLARSLGIPTKAEAAFSLCREGQLIEIDVGFANGIPFLNVIGLGLSTQVNRLARAELKRWIGTFAFLWTAFKVALRMSPFRVVVECGEEIHSAKTWQITVCNGRNYGNGLTIHEDASLQDRTLHGLSTEVKKWWHAFALIPALLRGRYRADHDVALFRGSRLRIRTKRPMHVDVDGELKTVTPLEVWVQPKALRIFVPKQETAQAPPAKTG